MAEIVAVVDVLRDPTADAFRSKLLRERGATVVSVRAHAAHGDAGGGEHGGRAAGARFGPRL